MIVAIHEYLMLKLLWVKVYSPCIHCVDGTCDSSNCVDGTCDSNNCVDGTCDSNNCVDGKFVECWKLL